MIHQLQELWQHRALVYYFAVRDIQGRFKQTFLGFSWAIVQPLFLMLIFSLIFNKFLRVDSGEVPYPIFSYTALLPWLFISRSLTASASSLLMYKALITKVYFPREIIPLASVLSSLVDFFAGALVFVLMLIYFQIELSWHVVFILLLLPLQMVFATAMAFLASSLTALFRDLVYAFPLVVQVWMYATPVIYGLQKIHPKYLPLFYLNPAAGIIEAYRQVLLYHQLPNMALLLSSAAISVLALGLGYWLFKKLESFVIDIL